MEQKVNKIGIEINEIIRALWLKFDRSYAIEFGEENVPDNVSYSYDFFKDYPWADVKEEVEMLNEDLPDDINPMDYQVDKETGKAPVDFLAFKKTTNELTAKQVYNRFMYEDYLFEIFGAAPLMYKNLDLDLDKFYHKYSKDVEFILFSKENWFSIPPTLFFLGKTMSRFKSYHFYENESEIWDKVDVLITTDPNIAENHNDKVIKLVRPYNDKNKEGLIKDILQINDLNGNEEFEKLINYTNKEKDKNDE